MIIDLCFASGDLRIRTRSTPAVRHAVALARVVLALGDDGHLVVRHSSKLPEIEFDGEPDLEQARQVADKLLSNPVIEDFAIRVDGAVEAVTP